MDRQERKCRPIARRGPWPDRSRAEVAFYCGERRTTERLARQLFGRPLKRWEYAALAGAPDDARVEVGALGGQIYLEFREPTMHFYQGLVQIRRSEAGPLLIDDDFQMLHPSMQGKRLGRHIFHRQLCYAKALGVTGIETLADRRGSDDGYYAWPRLGFDGALSVAVCRKLPAGLVAARTILDLMDSPDGRRWWRQHGVAIRVRFDLAEESRSWRAFLRYLWAQADSLERRSYADAEGA